MCERRVTPGGGRVFACHREHHVLSLRVRVEQARIAMLGGEDSMVAFLRGVSPYDESATCPSGDDTCNCVADEKIPPLAGAQRCFMACRESLAGEACACNPRVVMRPTPWDDEPVECIDLGPYYSGHVPEFPRELGLDEEPLRLVVCPLGEFCLGDGPTCFAVAKAIFVRLALDPPPATIAL